MKKLLLGLVASIFVLTFFIQPASATIWFSDDFETAWTGDYADGWENTAYRHGAPPVASNSR